MNQLLIKELLEKARVQDYWSVDEARFMVDHIDQNKFCKLIIERLCEEFDAVTVADHQSDEWDDGYDAGLVQAASSARALFGV